MAFILEEKQLEQFKYLNILHDNLGGEIFIADENTLIKVTNKYIYEMLQYLESIPEHENIVKILEAGKVINSKTEPQSCYRMKYLNDAKTFLELYREDIPYEQKLKYIKEIFDALKFLHQYIVLGDIHSKNILVYNNKAYLTDLDNSRKLNDYFNPIYCYYYLNILEAYGNTIYTDITKLYLEIFMLIVDVDFHFLIRKYGYRDVRSIITDMTLPDEVARFFEISKSKRKMKSLDEEIYDIERFIDPELEGLKRKLIKSFEDSYI